jgi:hypothetical protein
MTPQTNQPTGGSGGTQPTPSNSGGDAAKERGNERASKPHDVPRYDDRPPRPSDPGAAPERPTPGEAPRTTREPISPTPDEPKPATTTPRYGDRESDDPRRGTVEAGEDVDDSDKSGR